MSNTNHSAFVGLFFVIFLLLGANPTTSSAQTSKEKVLVQGIVINGENDEQLTGVHIFAKEAHVGAVSNQKGLFRLVATHHDTLVITMMGFERQFIPLNYFKENPIDLLISMDIRTIELPGLTISADPEIDYLMRSGKNPWKIYKYKPPADHPELDVPAGSLQYGPLSRWSKEAKEKRKLLRVLAEDQQYKTYIQTVTSDSVRQQFMYMYDITAPQYNDFIIYFNTVHPNLIQRKPEAIVRLMHETFISYRPRK